MIMMVFLILIAIMLEARIRTDIMQSEPSWWIIFGVSVLILILTYIFGFNWWYPEVQKTIRGCREFLCKKSLY
jgi:uncharacterized membrane protein